MRVVERRIGLLSAVFLLLFCVTLARAVWIQGVQGAELRADAQSQQTEIVHIPGPRGAVYDRQGRALAVSEDSAAVYATPFLIRDPAGVARQVAPILEMDEQRLLESLSDRSSGFAYLRRQVSTSAAARIERLGIEGVDTLPDTRRVYPQGRLAAQVLGAVGIDNDGLSGLELANEDVLGGQDGVRKIVKDALGDPIDLETVEETRAGRDIYLTLDATLQSHVESVLEELADKFDPAGATAIVMSPQSSELLAVANWPPLDANAAGGAGDEQLLNRATGFVYEPGSTFKAFTVAAALEEGIVSPGTVFDLPPTIEVADRTIREAHERGHVSLSVAEILAQSSNVGSVRVGMAVGARGYDSWIRRFGFGEPTGIRLPGEERGIVPALGDYSGSTMGNLPIGQGLSVTPMQMAAGYAAIANGGTLRPPRIVKSAAARSAEAESGRQVLDPRTADAVREMLAGVLAPGGTASQVEVAGYELAGKTGTAEKVVDGVYSKDRFVASFVGFAPVDDPELLVAIVVDEPKGSIYGADVAAPAFGQIASLALPYLGVAPE